MTALALMNAQTFADQFDDRRLDRLRSLTPTTEPMRADDLGLLSDGELAGVDILLTGWGSPHLDRSILDRLPRLAAVVHCGGSVKSLVSPWVWQRGIVVTSAAEVNAIPVAEFTFAAVVLAGKKAPFLAADARRHRDNWGYRHRRGPMSNLGLTVGIVGFSKVGRRVVDRVRQLEDVTCLVADPFADPKAVRTRGAQLVSLHSMLPEIDVLSIHAPLLPSTHHLIGVQELGLLPDHATVINTARGALLDTAALEAECRSGRLHAILDVTDPEPLPADSVLYDLPNVMITPHISGSLDTEIRRITDAALDEVERILTGRPLRTEVLEDDLGLSA
ncbi:hydroxyacid dehydrogenase [Actinoplanes sp. NPDC026619]|uniref:hydroxyacid dehydrogenase n=1 Tax=Actinoplanes sp. NPDC026619 TaxID=3155798 RepID=UPI0033D3FA5E